MTARRPRPPGAPTLSALARELGVTVPTVSKVLHHRSDVAPGTRDRVARRLREAGYVVAEAPQEVQVKGSRTRPALLDLVVPVSHGSWLTSMMSGVERQLAESIGSDVVVTVARPAPGTPSWVDRLIDRGSRGAVLALVTPTEQERCRLHASRVATVRVGPGGGASPDLPTIGADNVAGARLATEHLVELGHRRIGVITGQWGHPDARDRLEGYRQALQGAGLPFDPAYVRAGDWTRDGAARAAADLLDRPDRPTAVFACSDRMASGVYLQAARAGLAVPVDLSVVGFDDLPEAQWLAPALTTVRHPVEEMGAAAARLLVDALTRGVLAPRRRELSTVLVERGSTASPIAVVQS